MTDTSHYLIQQFVLCLKSEKGLSSHTILAYQRDLMALQEFHHLKFLTHLGQEDLEKYIAWATNNLSLRTVARHVSSIKQFYLFLKREGLIQINPANLVMAPSWGKNLPKILTQEEVDMLFKTAYQDTSIKGLRLCVMLEVLYASGLRVSELIHLKKSCVQNYNDYPILLIKGKGGKERLVPLHEKAYRQIQAYLLYVSQDTQYLFTARNNQPISRMRVFQLLKDLAVKADIDPDKISPHVIRHAFATHMLKNGADLMLLKEILGHANLSTSEIYLHVMPQDLKALLEDYHPLCTQLCTKSQD